LNDGCEFNKEFYGNSVTSFTFKYLRNKCKRKIIRVQCLKYLKCLIPNPKSFFKGLYGGEYNFIGNEMLIFLGST